VTAAILELVKRARAEGDFSPIVDAIPYNRFMGIGAEIVDDRVIGKLTFAAHLIGNAQIPALHGGTLGALLESTAIFELMWRADTARIPKTINITVEYLRSGKAMDTLARCDITKLGRRVANVRAIAWQDDPERPIAAAHANFLLTPPDGEK
jgi:uncharacterized protein (TIGR00369 family)